MIKLGIQGVKGSFHELAARHYFRSEELEFVECATFDLLCKSLADSGCDKIIMAVENSTAGSILPNYSLLENNNFFVVGEIYIRIHMNLLGLKDVSLEELELVESHPMALWQCQEFLSKNPHLKLIESADTAGSAKKIAEAGKNHVGAIASSLAAEIYGLEVLAKEIETNKKNYTRFLVLERDEGQENLPNSDKASLIFQTLHQPGALVHALSVLDSYRINMTKIQSVPIMGEDKKYSFHCDVEWLDRARFDRAMELLESETSQLRVLGTYRQGERVL